MKNEITVTVCDVTGNAMAIFFSKVLSSLKELETHPAFTCSKLPMQTPEKSAKSIQYSQ